MASSVFITALEARQNPIRERVVFDESTVISSAILEAVRTGFYNALVDGGSPMTQNVAITTSVYSIDDTTNTFTVVGHGYNTGDEVFISTTGELPSPLEQGVIYYVIYVSSDTIRLAATKQDALAARPISIDLVSGVNSITLTNPGTGYTATPSVTISGGNATTDATAFAYLAPYGDVSYIVVGDPGAGYHYVPTVSIVAQGAGAIAGTVSFGAVAATINAAGVNYRSGDLLTIVGGAGTSATITVGTVSNTGAILTVAVATAGAYTTLPSLIAAPTTVIPGGGTGATIDLTMGIVAIAVSSGGSQYTAPPTVSISGGGGSGATATTTVTGGAVFSISITERGSGYTGSPTVTIGSGSGATAVAYLTPTGVGNITLLSNGGNTYTTPPAVTITAAGSGATVSAVYMQITSAALSTGGAGSQYVVGDILIVAGGAGSASATIRVNVVDLAGSIVDYTLLTSGLYTTLPVMTNNAVYGGHGQAASFNLTAGLNSVALSSGGTGYTAPPTVVITPNDATGSGAGAYTVLTGDSVSNVVVTSPGTAYTAAPTVTISSGSGATAVATLVATGVQYVNVTDGGSGYTTAQINFITNYGIGAAATPIIVGGAITGITVTNNGYGYVEPPLIAITGDGVGATAVAQLQATAIDSLSIVDYGNNYTSIPDVTIPGTATANVSLYSTGIEQIVVTNGGENYTSDPQVFIIPGAGETEAPVSPTTTVIRGFSIATVIITNQGSGYTSAPTVTISAPSNLNGNTATATATIGYGSGTSSIIPYPASRDYWLVWQNLTPSDTNLTRPYADRMDTIINYFTNLGYTIQRQTNPRTNNTLQWNIKW